MWDEDTCPACGSEDIAPLFGHKESPILLVGEFPGADEIKKGIPFIGKTGGILRTELALKGLDLNRMQRCNMWLHVPNGKEECLRIGIEQVIKGSKGKQIVLLIGSETVRYFCKENVSAVNGLVVTSPYLSVPVVMACVQPATVFHGSIGELRFAIGEFAKQVDIITKEIQVKDEW